jgi:hypothetical protein
MLLCLRLRDMVSIKAEQNDEISRDSFKLGEDTRDKVDMNVPGHPDQTARTFWRWSTLESV